MSVGICPGMFVLIPLQTHFIEARNVAELNVWKTLVFLSPFSFLSIQIICKGIVIFPCEESQRLVMGLKVDQMQQQWQQENVHLLDLHWKSHHIDQSRSG